MPSTGLRLKVLGQAVCGAQALGLSIRRACRVIGINRPANYQGCQREWATTSILACNQRKPAWLARMSDRPPHPFNQG